MTADILTRARTALVLDHPFFASLVLRLPLVADPSVETMTINGERIRYNPAFAESLTVKQAVGVLAHEVMHCALSHHTRKGNRDHELWNSAGDYAINPILISAGLELPEGAFLDARFAGKSAEEIYRILDEERDPGEKPSDEPKSGEGGGDPGGCGSVEDPPPGDGKTEPSPADLTASEQNWKVATMQAAQAAKAQGALPGEIARLVEELRRPAVDWREALRRFFQASSPTDYRWTPPNRRLIAQGLYLPGLKDEALADVAVAIDTSGSIGQAELDQFAAELNSILEEAKPQRLIVIYCDARVAHVDEYEPSDFPVTLTAHGGGGTDFAPPFRWLDAAGVVPACMVYLTDLYGPFPADPGFPVLWGSTTKDKAAPFGETLYIPPKG